MYAEQIMCLDGILARIESTLFVGQVGRALSLQGVRESKMMMDQGLVGADQVLLTRSEMARRLFGELGGSRLSLPS